VKVRSVEVGIKDKRLKIINRMRGFRVGHCWKHVGWARNEAMARCLQQWTTLNPAAYRMEYQY
jgi:hypothetical protein